MRKKWVIGNWKMFTTASTARALAAAVVQGVAGEQRVGVAVCPPFPYLGLVGEAIKGSPVQLGAQNAYCEKEGAFTGEVSPVMLTDLGCRFVILGHSERRHVLGESDGLINRKVHAALAAGLHVVFCLGETLEERKSNRTHSVLRSQLDAGLSGLDAATMSRVIVAYEPVWAIGTGLNATPQQAQEAHVLLRRRVSDLFGEETATALPLLYGGSVKPSNAAELLRQPDVDGGLIGGSSLKGDEFLAIVRAAL